MAQQPETFRQAFDGRIAHLDPDNSQVEVKRVARVQ